MGPLSSVGSRWGWPFLAGIAALIGGSVGGWLPLERTGLALLGVVILCWLGTLLNLALVTAHGESAGATAVAGDRLIVRYTLRNRSPWPLAWAMLEPHGLSEVPVEGQFVALGPRQTRQIAVSLPCPRRGRWAAAGWTVHAGDPFGLFDRQRSRWDGETVIVYPRPVPLPALALPASLGAAGSRRGRPDPRPSAAIRELRPYRSGDPPSRIHWLSTARLDTLMVKEPEGEPMAQVWLLLDLQAAVQHGEDEGSSAELIIGVACGLIDRLAGAAAVGLLIAGPSTIVAPDGRHGRGHGERLRAALALTDTGDGTIEAAFDLARHTAAGQSLGGGQGTVIALTPWADGQWAAHLARLARGNAVLCILLATPEGDAGEAHAAQAANLGRLGVRVYRHLDWAV